MSIPVHIAMVHSETEKVSWLVLRQESRFRTVWNLIMTGLLLITAIWVPFAIAFLDDDLGILVEIGNYFIDFCFAADIVITFL